MEVIDVCNEQPGPEKGMWPPFDGFPFQSLNGDGKDIFDKLSTTEIILGILSQYSDFNKQSQDEFEETGSLITDPLDDYIYDPIQEYDLMHILNNVEMLENDAKEEEIDSIDWDKNWDHLCLFFTQDTLSPAFSSERRGGITWVRSPKGMLIPCLEDTWLKQMLLTFLSSKTAAQQFIMMLQEHLERAVIFLYKEGIKPYLGDVANQMKSMIPDNFWSASEVAYVALLCKDEMELRSELRVKGEIGWVIYLLRPPADFTGFVNTHSHENTFRRSHWKALNKFIIDIMSAEEADKRLAATGNTGSQGFSGGRYAFAERLRAEVEIFRDMRLGELIHLVQLAINRGVFVYSQRVLLPVSACEKVAGEMFPNLRKDTEPLCLSLKEIEENLSLLVDELEDGLVLAQLKQQFLMKFKKELDPAMFGHSKLQDFLLSKPFSKKYRLFVPIDSPHRTHIQHVSYMIPKGCRLFQKTTLDFDFEDFYLEDDDYYIEEDPMEMWEFTFEFIQEPIKSMIEEVLGVDDEMEDTAWDDDDWDFPNLDELPSDYFSNDYTYYSDYSDIVDPPSEESSVNRYSSFVRLDGFQRCSSI